MIVNENHLLKIRDVIFYSYILFDMDDKIMVSMVVVMMAMAWLLA
jgi:hypothetical protein